MRTMPRGRNMLDGAILVLGDANALTANTRNATSAASARVREGLSVGKSLQFMFSSSLQLTSVSIAILLLEPVYRGRLFVLSAGLPGMPGSPAVTGYRVMVTPEVAMPPVLDRTVTTFGGGTLVKRMVNTPGANGITGPMTPVYGSPVAGLMIGSSPFGPASVTVRTAPGVKSLALITSRAMRWM